MRAITVRQPTAYLAGALLGDAWLSAGSGRSPGGYLCLRVADADFADAFAAAIRDGYGVITSPRRDERGYWLVRTYNGHGRFNSLREYAASTDEERAVWLRGLFDSEGNAQLLPKPTRGPQSFDRRVAFYSTDLRTLAIADHYMESLGITTKIRAVSPSVGHKGSRQVHELEVRANREAYARFATLVGSSIGRKATVLAALAASYVDDIPGRRREMQAVGAATRRARRDAGGTY
jgi:hypothetical protein